MFPITFTQAIQERLGLYCIELHSLLRTTNNIAFLRLVKNIR